MYKTVQQCNHCGANLTLDDMRRSDCPYCQTVYPHHSQAAQHAQVAGQMMGNVLAQQAQIQNQWRGGFGLPPQPQQLQPPPTGAPGYGTPPGYGSPFNGHHATQAHINQAMATSRRVTIIALVVGLLIFALSIAGFVVAMLVAR